MSYFLCAYCFVLLLLHLSNGTCTSSSLGFNLAVLLVLPCGTTADNAPLFLRSACWTRTSLIKVNTIVEIRRYLEVRLEVYRGERLPYDREARASDYKESRCFNSPPPKRTGLFRDEIEWVRTVESSRRKTAIRGGEPSIANSSEVSRCVFERLRGTSATVMSYESTLRVQSTK